MRWWMGLPLTWAVLMGVAQVWPPLNYGVVLVGAWWAARESRKLNAPAYKSLMAMGPVGTFFCVAVWSLIAFPAFLNFRSNVLAKRAVLKAARA